MTLDGVLVVTSCPDDGENLVMTNLRCRDFIITTGVNSSLAQGWGRHAMSAEQLSDKQTVHGGGVSVTGEWSRNSDAKRGYGKF
jgi:hypothetical protein